MQCESDDAIIIGGNKDLGEEILEDMRAYNAIVESYDFKTEQLRIDLKAAVMNLHMVKDHVVKEHLSSKTAVHKAVLADVDYDKLASYFLHRSNNAIKRRLKILHSMQKV